MNLDDALAPEHGEPIPDEYVGREDLLYAWGFVQGYAVARGMRLAVSTDGPTLRVHNLQANTRSAALVRKGLREPPGLLVALSAQLEVMRWWEAESVTWGPDPWRPDG